MKRDKSLLEKRVKKIGMFFEIKKSQELSSKRAVIEIAEILGIAIDTVHKDLTKYRREVSI